MSDIYKGDVRSSPALPRSLSAGGQALCRNSWAQPSPSEVPLGPQHTSFDVRQAAGGVKLNNEVALRLKVRCHDVPPAPSEPAVS